MVAVGNRLRSELHDFVNRVAIENLAGLIQDSHSSHETTQTITKASRLTIFLWCLCILVARNFQVLCERLRLSGLRSPLSWLSSRGRCLDLKQRNFKTPN